MDLARLTRPCESSDQDRERKPQPDDGKGLACVQVQSRHLYLSQSLSVCGHVNQPSERWRQTGRIEDAEIAQVFGKQTVVRDAITLIQGTCTAECCMDCSKVGGLESELSASPRGADEYERVLIAAKRPIFESITLYTP